MSVMIVVSWIHSLAAALIFSVAFWEPSDVCDDRGFMDSQCRSGSNHVWEPSDVCDDRVC